MKLLKVLKFILNEKSNKGEKFKRLIFAFLWQLWKRIVKKPVIIELDNKAKYISFPNTPMGSFPIYAKIYDSEKILFLRKILKEKGIIIDIGANMGIYALLLKDNYEKVILFEPVKETADNCEANMKLNGINYEMYRIALGSKTGWINFEIKGNFDTTAKVKEEGGNYKVKMDKLDNIVNREYYKKLEFIKIDVEGYEFNVLEGATQVIKESAVKLIQFERLRTTPIEPLLNFFKQINWLVFALNDGKISYYQKDIYSAHDLFAVRDRSFINIH